jgi:membrane protein YdbS with pleckstrin-like domain
MTCHICGTELVAGAAYCHGCGAPVKPNGDNADFASAPAALYDAPASPDPQPPSATPQSPAARITSLGGPGPRGAAEIELWQGGYAPRAMLGEFLAADAASVLLIVAGVIQSNAIVWWIVAALILLMWLWLGARLAARKLGVRYRLTSQRFFHESGILRRVTDRIEVIDFDDITNVQGLLERMAGVGRIKITSSDRTHPELWLYGIADVQRVAGLFDSARHAERVRRGLHIETT